MHIGLFIKDFAVGKKFDKNGMPFKSGAEFHGENHAKQLIKRGHSVSIFAKKKFYFTKARENLSGIDLVRLHAPFRGIEVILRMLTSHRDLDAIYVLGKPKFAVWAIMLARWLHIPVTLALTGVSEVFDKNESWRWKIFAECQHYIALSQEIKRGFVERAKIPENKITVLSQGIDATKFVPIAAEKKFELRQKYGIKQNVPVLLFCARIAINKGIDTLLKIWPEIHRRIPDAVFCIVGGGQKELVDALMRMGSEADNSVWLVGEVDDPLEYYQLSDVYIFPSRHEGCPTTLMEAMACGLPSVVSDIGGCEDLIEDNISGYRVDSETAHDFVENVCRIFQDEKLRMNMSDNAVNFVRRYSDYSSVIERLEHIITE